MKLSQLQLVSSLPIDSLAALTGSLICLSLSPIFIRLSEIEIGPSATAFNRFWIAAIAFGAIEGVLAVKRQKGETQAHQQKYLSFHQFFLLIADGIILSIALISWTWSLTHTSVANSTMMHYFCPIFTVLGGWFAFRQRFDLRFLIGMSISIAGVVLLEVDNLVSLNFGIQFIGDLAALLSAVFFGLHPLIMEKLRIDLNSITILVWSSTASSLLLLPITWMSEEQLFPSSITSWCSVIALAVFGQMLGVGLLSYCLKTLSAGFTSLATLLVPVLSTIEGWMIFSEALNLWIGCSFMVIIGGMYLAISSTSAIKSEV